MQHVVWAEAATHGSRPPRLVALTVSRGARAAVRVIATVGFAVAAACSGSAPRAAESAPTMSASAVAVRTLWTADIDSMRQSLRRLDSSLTMLSRDPRSADGRTRAHATFFAARAAFKRTEFLSAFYEPTTTKAMNGAVVPRVDEGEGPEVVFPPEGFQVIEELLFADVDSARAVRAAAETRNLINYATRLNNAASRQHLTDDRVFDAAKLEIARIAALGIAGYDSPIARHSVVEAADALRGLQRALLAYRDRLGLDAADSLDHAFVVAIEQLSAGDSFEQFNRLRFIVAGANPLARAVVAARDRLALGVPQEHRAFRMTAVTLFDTNAFDATAFAAPGTMPATAAQVALGRSLFFDPELSGDASRSCASCHDPSRAFTDGLPRSRGMSARAVLRNAPTMINAGLQIGSFYDLRTLYLEDQVTDVVGNVDEMHGNPDATAARLSANALYASRFRAAFPRDSVMSGRLLRSAIASYLRSLQALNSPVDRAFRGDTMALDAEERAGLNVFLGKGTCGTCHFAPLFNGTVPPTYRDNEFEVLGVPTSPVTRGASIDPDPGHFRQSHAAPHAHAFKVPSIRNVSLTAPYMHNGVYRTLEQVVDFYNRGGGAGIGADVPNQTLPMEPLGMSATEQRALVRFMRTLTDTVGTTRTH